MATNETYLELHKKMMNDYMKKYSQTAKPHRGDMFVAKLNAIIQKLQRSDL